MMMMTSRFKILVPNPYSTAAYITLIVDNALLLDTVDVTIAAMSFYFCRVTVTDNLFK